MSALERVLVVGHTFVKRKLGLGPARIFGLWTSRVPLRRAPLSLRMCLLSFQRCSPDGLLDDEQREDAFCCWSKSSPDTLVWRLDAWERDQRTYTGRHMHRNLKRYRVCAWRAAFHFSMSSFQHALHDSYPSSRRVLV